jgi:hypothetical protein
MPPASCALRVAARAVRLPRVVCAFAQCTNALVLSSVDHAASWSLRPHHEPWAASRRARAHASATRRSAADASRGLPRARATMGPAHDKDDCTRKPTSFSSLSSSSSARSWIFVVFLCPLCHSYAAAKLPPPPLSTPLPPRDSPTSSPATRPTP